MKIQKSLESTEETKEINQSVSSFHHSIGSPVPNSATLVLIAISLIPKS
jgi:hypothetical protein